MWNWDISTWILFYDPTATSLTIKSGGRFRVRWGVTIKLHRSYATMRLDIYPPFTYLPPYPPHPSNDVAATVVVCTQDGKLFSSKSFRLIITFSLFLSFFLSFSLSLSAVYLNISLSSLFISLSVFLFVYFLSILLISIFSCHNFSSRTYVGYVYLFDVFVSVHCAVLAIWLVCFVFWVLGTFMHLLACSLIILSTYVFSVLTSANLSSKLHVNVTVNRLIDSI